MDLMITINPERKKPPLPPKPKRNQMQWKIEEDSSQQIQKLIAMNDKLNIEVGVFRKQLCNERLAVRELRVAHESEYRKLKNETKKLLEVVGNVKKASSLNSQKHLNEIVKLSEEIATLNKKQKSCTCATSAVKGQKNNAATTNDVDQVTEAIKQRSKAEIQRLLDELKQKDREISAFKNQRKKKQQNQMRINMSDESVERFVTHVDLTEPANHSPEDATFKAVIKMDENNHHTIMTRPDNNSTNVRTSSKATTIIELKESNTMQGQGSSKSVDIFDGKSLEFLQKKYELMKKEILKYEKELFESRARIEELEQSLVEQNNNFMDNDRVQEEMLEREKRLEKETHELREQNELLEFRILELEENQDKWSLRSNLTPDSKDTCNCWREKDSDDLMMMSSDSGITSPNSQHFDQQSVSPCSISLMDQLPTDDMRAHITKILSKRAFYNEEDKSCFQQILILLNSLEALSHDQSDEFSSMDYSSMDKIKSSPSRIPEPVLPPSSQNQQQQHQPSPPPKHQKIIATVQPYSTNGFRSFSEPKKEEVEPSVQTQETQTDADVTFKTNAELYAEIDKLNRFRKKVEESSKTSLGSVSPSISNTSAPLVSSDCDTIERRHLKFYQERMKMLEEKIEVYESTGDVQTKLLSKRLEHEVNLESKVNQLTETVEKLKRKNQELEESNCELDEMENETRHRWQKLEEEFEVMNQRNSELEMSKSCYQEKYEEARDSVEYLEECLHGSEERIKALEAHQKELKRRLSMSQSFIPAVALFQMWKLRKMILPMIKPPAKSVSFEIPQDHPIHKKLLDSQMREKQLTQNIQDLNRAYHETLENADNLWAQMEKEYKDKIVNYERLETSLRSKIQSLEKRLLKDTEDSYERIAALEENEYQLKTRAGKLSREVNDHQRKNRELLEEVQSAKDENVKLQAYIDGPLAEALDKEKKKLRRTEEDLQLVRNALKDTENAHKNEQILLKRQLQKMHKELKNFEVTNSELKEEVDTLERRIIELEAYRGHDGKKIQELIDELETKCQQQQNARPLRQINTTKSLAQELSQNKPMPVVRQKTVIPIERCSFADAIERFEKQFDDQRVTREVKSLADSIISNAENNGFVPIKRSFVEEARQKFSKWM